TRLTQGGNRRPCPRDEPAAQSGRLLGDRAESEALGALVLLLAGEDQAHSPISDRVREPSDSGKRLRTEGREVDQLLILLPNTAGHRRPTSVPDVDHSPERLSRFA